MLLSSFQAKPLLAARAAGKETARSSIDLNLHLGPALLNDQGVTFEEGGLVSWELLEKVADHERKVFRVEEGVLTQIQVFSETTGWLRTLAATPTAPTTLVSGIPMHRIKDTDPVADTRAKIKALGPLKGRVLDTATGLGYTAIAAARAASEVVTIELDPAAIEIARQNPWSQELFQGTKIRQVIGDAFEEVGKLEAGGFTAILHDPPTLSLGGELYSEEFYRHLHRLLRRGGRLFHYIGDPKSALGKRMYPGVGKRLNAAGFKRVVTAEDAHGVTAEA